jgi:chlorite dismutase
MSDASSHGHGARPEGGAPQKRQFVSYSFYKVAPEWRRLPCEQREAQKEELLQRLDAFDPETVIRSYTTMGLRGDVDFLLWKISNRLDALQELATTIASTDLGAYLTTPHNFLAMTRRSTYVDNHSHPGQEGRRTTMSPAGAKYFFVYPFVKTHAWYQLPFSERQRMMDEHIKVGHEFPTVKINTTYSFGLDDQEFVVGFESDSPSDFLDLVMKLREAEQRPYTERDTPIFSCIAKPLDEVLESLG